MSKTHKAPHTVGQTGRVWCVHIEGRSIFPGFNYTNRTATEAMFLALVDSVTPFRSEDLELTNFGYDDVTVMVDDKWMAQALVSCLSTVLPEASEAWRNDYGNSHSVYAVGCGKTAEGEVGSLYWNIEDLFTEETLIPQV